MSYLEEQFNLKDKVAVVTGGLGMLGSEYTQALAQAGAKVAVVDVKTPAKDHVLVSLQKIWREGRRLGERHKHPAPSAKSDE